jgi:hypothetical protein
MRMGASVLSYWGGRLPCQRREWGDLEGVVQQTWKRARRDQAGTSGLKRDRQEKRSSSPQRKTSPDLTANGAKWTLFCPRRGFLSSRLHATTEASWPPVAGLRPDLEHG